MKGLVDLISIELIACACITWYFRIRT